MNIAFEDLEVRCHFIIGTHNRQDVWRCELVLSGMRLVSAQHHVLLIAVKLALSSFKRFYVPVVLRDGETIAALLQATAKEPLFQKFCLDYDRWAFPLSFLPQEEIPAEPPQQSDPNGPTHDGTAQGVERD